MQPFGEPGLDESSRLMDSLDIHHIHQFRKIAFEGQHDSFRYQSRIGVVVGQQRTKSTDQLVIQLHFHAIGPSLDIFQYFPLCQQLGRLPTDE